MDIWIESCHSFPPWCICICIYDVLTPVMLLWTSSPPAAFPHMWAQLRSVAPLKPGGPSLDRFSQISGRLKVQKQNQLGQSNQHHGVKTFIFFSQEILETNKKQLKASGERWLRSQLVLLLLLLSDQHPSLRDCTRSGFIIQLNLFIFEFLFLFVNIQRKKDIAG